MRNPSAKGLSYKFLILFTTVSACVILAIFVGFILNETIVYTHFFYIPILLAGVWYRKKAIYVACFLSLVYILVTLFSPQTKFSVHVLERSVILVVVAYVIGLVSEKRAKVGEEIIRERDKFQKIVSTITEIIFIVDCDLKVLELSKPQLRAGIEGGDDIPRVYQRIPPSQFIEREAVIGEQCYKRFWGKEKICDDCPVPSVFEKGEGTRKVRSFVLADGTVVYLDVEYVPVFDEKGNVVQVIGDMRDITEQKRMEEELKDAEERYRVIFEHALTALCVIGGDGKISLVNKEFETLSGYSSGEIEGKKWTDFILEEDLERMNRYYKERSEGGAPACCVFKFISRDGEIKHVNTCIEPIRGPKRCIASLLDVTALKRKEDELRETCEKLKELDKMKMDFLNVAYHEMRSPLSPIVGYASLLERLKLTDRGRKYVYNIGKCARQLEKMINRMLELARIDSRKVELILEEFSIPRVVEEVVNSLEPEAKKKKQKISTVIPEIEIQADKQKTVAIFTNLVSNAIKYTPEKGRINVMVDDKGEDIRVCVADTGIGIPEEHLPMIFERFYMVDTSLTRKSGSLGLGLSIVKEYVKLHGGRVWATSELGKGSKFFFIMLKRQK